MNKKISLDEAYKQCAKGCTVSGDGIIFEGRTELIGCFARYADLLVARHAFNVLPEVVKAAESLLSLGVAENFGVWEDWEEVRTMREILAKVKSVEVPE